MLRTRSDLYRVHYVSRRSQRISLIRLHRFVIALKNMLPRNLAKTKYPNFINWEKSDRAVLCRSFEIVRQDGYRWSDATESAGWSGDRPGPRYLRWLSLLSWRPSLCNVTGLPLLLGSSNDHAKGWMNSE